MSATFAENSRMTRSSAFNYYYLFLFAQMTLAHQNAPPTPPPLNALGLPCNAMCRLWAWVQKQEQAKESAAPAEVEEKDLKGAEARITSDKAQCKTGSWDFSTSSWSFFTVSLTANLGEFGEAAAEAAAEVAAETETPVLPEVAEAAEMIAPLAKKITEYILNYQDDAASNMNLMTETMKCFREQREASGNQRAAIDSRFDRQREDNMQIKAEMQSMQLRFDEAHSKMDRKMDQLVKNIADLVK